MSIGPLIIDLEGTEITSEEKELIQHPLVGGIIFFSRNYKEPNQIKHVCQQLRQLRQDPLLITIDQEGGRVQRFRSGFTDIPPMGEIGQLYEQQAEEAIRLAEKYGYIMASELLNIGIDISFAPVLDLNKGLNNSVVGDRSFHHHPETVIVLAEAIMRGMNQAGMAATGKHFPGHGSVNIDSHHEIPIDHRELKSIEEDDLKTFTHLIQNGIQGIMAAHIVFPKIDNKPVGFSSHWLKGILRSQLGFRGVIFSDDLNMEGAKSMGNYVERAAAALDAGCDMILMCNNRSAVLNILNELPTSYFVDANKFNLMKSSNL